MKKFKGFSLIEVIIVITVIGVVGVITSTILNRSYTAGSNSTRLSKLRQSGDLALNEIAENIRSAEGVICYGPPSSGAKTQITLRTALGKYIKYKFVPQVVNSSGGVTQNGYIGKQVGLANSDFAIFCTDQLVLPAVTAITNNDVSSGVNITNGSFTKLTNSVSKDKVLIKFSVNETLKNSATGAADLVNMQTSVQTR